MSELKYQLMLNKDMSWVPCYLKSEADKFIADLDESHKMEVEQLLMEIAGLKKLVETADKLLKPKGGFTIKNVTFGGVELEGIRCRENGRLKKMNSKQFIEIRSLIENEFSHAVTKHPKFCDQFIDESARTWAEAETRIKARNSQPPACADCVLMEEVAEAFNAYSQGDLEHSLQEFAQVGAVVMRCMGFVMEKKLEKENHAKNGETKD